MEKYKKKFDKFFGHINMSPALIFNEPSPSKEPRIMSLQFLDKNEFFIFYLFDLHSLYGGR